MLGPRSSHRARGDGRAASPSANAHAHHGPSPSRPPPSPRHVRCMRDGRAVAPRAHATAAPRAPAPRRQKASRRSPVCGSTARARCRLARVMRLFPHSPGARRPPRAHATRALVHRSQSLLLPRSFFLFRPGRAVAQLLVSWRCVARRQPLRANTSAASRAARQGFVCACARSTRGSARPHAGVTVFAIGLMYPALQPRKNARHQLPARPRRSVPALIRVRFPLPRAVTPFAAGLFSRQHLRRAANVAPARRGKTTK